MSSYAERAQSVQDEIGWADSNDPMETTMAMLNLARLVREMAGELDRLVRQAGFLPEVPLDDDDDERS